jgi:phosphopantothenoylcysteine decarboxylase
MCRWSESDDCKCLLNAERQSRTQKNRMTQVVDTRALDSSISQHVKRLQNGVPINKYSFVCKYTRELTPVLLYMEEEQIPSSHHNHRTTCPMTNPSPTPFSASAFAEDGKHHILLAGSGSVATIKIAHIANAFAAHPNVSIRIVLTSSAEKFLQGQSDEIPDMSHVEQLKSVDGVYYNLDEWKKPWVRGDKILHIELRRWAHVLLLAPLSANTLAKMVNGISDNLLTSVLRAWDTTGMVDERRKFVFVAPAMNTAMWRHPITAKQVRVLEKEEGWREWVRVLRPTEKELACGDTGDGAMMDWREIVEVLEKELMLESADAANSLPTVVR